MMWALSYLGANFALIIVVVLAVAGCALVWWLTKNLWAVVAALTVLAVGFAVQQIDHNAFNRAQAEQKAVELKVLQGRIDTLSKVAADDAKRAATDAADIATLREQASNTPANSSPGLPLDSAKRVGDVR
jgi:apolipoprotein N-acyltransferase